MSPLFGFATPFLARKGDGGMVETVVAHRRYMSGAEVLRQSPLPTWGERIEVRRLAERGGPSGVECPRRASLPGG